MSEDDLSPHEQEVRRLLADARHDQPMPPAVSARMERVLADLADEPARVAPVTQLASRRRRARQLLVAAAAVVVIGVGVGQVLDRTGGGADSMSSADRDAGGAPAAESKPAPQEQGEDTTDGGSTATVPQGAQADEKSRRVTALSSATFDDDVSELAAKDPVPRSGTFAYDGARSNADALIAACEARSWGKGRFVAVRYDGTPAVLVFRRPLGDVQVADLYLCGGAEPTRSVTLPAP